MTNSQLKMKNVLLLILALYCGNLFPQNKVDFKSFSNKELDAKVEKILAKMSPDEKLAQLTGIRPDLVMENGKLSLPKCRKVIPNGIGHFCQFASGTTLRPVELRDFVRDLQHYLMTVTPAKLPAIFHEEAITGFSTRGATTFPQQIGMGCSWNPEQIRKNTATTAINMRSVGATYALSPMLDLGRTAHWERIEESFGEDAYLTSAMGLAFINGLQGSDLQTGVACTIKHFAAYGVKNYTDREFYEEYLMPHEVAIKLGNVKSVMPSYATYKGFPCVANEELLTTVLRKELGFDGIVISDYGAVRRTFSQYKKAASRTEAGALAINAGMDVELAEPICFPLLPNAVKDNQTTWAKIDNAVRRVLIMKARLGLLDAKPEVGKDGDLNLDPPANRKLAYESACQSIVLLKNNGILPLKKELKKIALVGPNAASVQGLLGDYTYQSLSSFWWNIQYDINDPKLVTLSEALKAKIGNNVTILHERGCDWSTPLESRIKSSDGDDRLSKIKTMLIKDVPQPNLENAIKISSESDVIIAAMGENVYLCGEGRARKNIKLPGEQEAFVQKLIATGKPVILVLFGGRQQIITDLEPKCAAVVQAWFPGEEGGNAVADILLGNVNPSAKLCVSYPKTEDKYEMYYNKGYAKENQPLYPFGYGLSYTSFKYRDFKLNSKVSITDQWIEMSFKVKNTGSCAGTEIVQLYVSPKDSASTMKPIQLKGYQRVDLKVGEEKTVTFKVSPQQLSQYIAKQWIISPGKYVFKAAASCTDIRLSAIVELTGENAILKNGRSVFFSMTK